MDLRKGSKRIKSIYKGENYIPGLMVNGRLWQGAPGNVELANANGDANYHKVYYGLTIGGDSGREWVTIDSGGMVKNTTVNYDGRLLVFSGFADNTTIEYDGSMTVVSGSANNTLINPLGSAIVSHDGKMNNTKLVDGRLYIHGGSVYNTEIFGYAHVYVESSAGYSSKDIQSVTINSGGSMFIENTGVGDHSGVRHVIIESGGYMQMSGGAARADDITVSSGGTLRVYGEYSSATNVTSMTGADVRANDGATITYK